MGIVLILLVLIFVFGIVGAVILTYFPGHSSGTTKPHSDNHPGITVNTLSGKKDIICPKCKCHYCNYHYDYSVIPVTAKTRTKVHLFNPFKPFVEDVTTISGGDVIKHENYMCMNCGYIFR